ncbi:hypothetical protein M2149_000818 [Lachnospiraceae bacterium PFB1-21]
MSSYSLEVNQQQGVIDFNFEELKKSLELKMAEYEGSVFTEENKDIAKKEVASLRALKKEVDAKRIEIKKQSMEPYNAFESKVKELTGIIDRPIELISRQIEEMEEKRITEKKFLIQELFHEAFGSTEELSFISLENISDSKWTNASVSKKAIKDQLEEIKARTLNELAIIGANPSDAKKEALDLYKINRDLTAALTHINTYEANKAKALEREEEKKKQEEERRIQAEIGRAKADERKRLEEIEQAKKDAVKEEVEGFQTDDSLPFIQKDTQVAYYKVVATAEELERVEMAFSSIGIEFERVIKGA